MVITMSEPSKEAIEAKPIPCKAGQGFIHWKQKNADKCLICHPERKAAQPQRSETAEEILARQDKQDDESFGDLHDAASSEPQEWSIRTDHNEPDAGWIYEGENKISHRMPVVSLVRIKDAHNAALAAEREKREQAERDAVNEKAIADGICESAESERKELDQQLLAAQAAIAEHNRASRPFYEIKADLSALEAHDAEVRKPLVEALKAAKHKIRADVLYQSDADEVCGIIDAALAQVKK